MKRYLLIEQAKSKLIASLMHDGLDAETAREVANKWVELCESAPEICEATVANVRELRPN